MRPYLDVYLLESFVIWPDDYYRFAWFAIWHSVGYLGFLFVRLLIFSKPYSNDNTVRRREVFEVSRRLLSQPRRQFSLGELVHTYTKQLAPKISLSLKIFTCQRIFIGAIDACVFI